MALHRHQAVGGFAFLHQRADDVGLPPGFQLLTDEVVQAVAPVFRHQPGLYRLTARGQLIDDAYIQIAQQAAELCEDKKVVVIPTKNVAMGIAAAIACQPELSPEQNAARMEEAAQRVRTGTVTYAVRDTDLDDLHIHQGDIIGLYNGKIQTVGNDVQDVTLRLMEAIVTDEDELITVYYGKDTKEDDAQALTDELASRYGDCDVEMQMGGQPLYYYLVSVE